MAAGSAFALGRARREPVARGGRAGPGRTGRLDGDSSPGERLGFIEDDVFHVLVRINPGRPGFSHENGPPRLAINIGPNIRHATLTMTPPFRDSTVCAQPRTGATRGAHANSWCFVHTVQADDLDEDGISIGPGAPGPQGVTCGGDLGGDLYADLRASGNMALAGHAITNFCGGRGRRRQRVAGRADGTPHRGRATVVFLRGAGGRLGADGISIPADGLDTPDSKGIVSRAGEELGDSLAGIVSSRRLRAKVAPHADGSGAIWASHAGVVRARLRGRGVDLALGAGPREPVGRGQRLPGETDGA